MSTAYEEYQQMCSELEHLRSETKDLQQRLAIKDLEIVRLREALELTRSDLFLQIESKYGAKASSEYPSIVKAQELLSTQ